MSINALAPDVCASREAYYVRVRPNCCADSLSLLSARHFCLTPCLYSISISIPCPFSFIPCDQLVRFVRRSLRGIRSVFVIWRYSVWSGGVRFLQRCGLHFIPRPNLFLYLTVVRVIKFTVYSTNSFTIQYRSPCPSLGVRFRRRLARSATGRPAFVRPPATPS